MKNIKSKILPLIVFLICFFGTGLIIHSLKKYFSEKDCLEVNKKLNVPCKTPLVLPRSENNRTYQKDRNIDLPSD